jgi:hypothetical protein
MFDKEIACILLLILSRYELYDIEVLDIRGLSTPRLMSVRLTTEPNKRQADYGVLELGKAIKNSVPLLNFLLSRSFAVTSLSKRMTGALFYYSMRI